MLVEGYGFLLCIQIMNSPKAVTRPITALRDTASTVTSTDSAPSLMSSAPAMMIRMSQIMVILLF